MHAAPIGPHVDAAFRDWTLYPFQTSTTFANLHRTGRAVFHVTDDAFLLTATVLGYGNRQFSSGQNSESGPVKSTDPRLSLSGETSLKRRDEPTTIQKSVGFWKLSPLLRIAITEWDTSTPRAKGICRVAKRGTMGEFCGMESSQTFAVGISDLGQQTAHDRSRDLARRMDRHLRH